MFVKNNVFLGQACCVPTTKLKNCFNRCVSLCLYNQIAWWRNANSFSRAQLAIQVIFARTFCGYCAFHTRISTQKSDKAQKSWKISPSGVKTLHTYLHPLRDGVVIGFNGVFIMRSRSDNVGCCEKWFWKVGCLNGRENNTRSASDGAPIKNQVNCL